MNSRAELMIIEVENERLIKLIWPWQMPSFFKEKEEGVQMQEK